MLHVPVLLREILTAIENMPGPKATALDCTFGRGGHSRAFLSSWPDLHLTALDRDATAIAYGQAQFAEEVDARRLSLIHQSFSDFAKGERQPYQTDNFDFILMDLGVSSPQLDEAGRGFSFYETGPLDMRMDHTQERTAAQIVNEWSEEDLIELFCDIGEVRRPQRVVKAIVHDRERQPFISTTQLSEMIARVEGWRIKGKHPATQYFLALRIATNLEYSQIKDSIPLLVRKLRPQGRLMVITFHSAEDRIVKYILRDLEPWGLPVNKKVIIPAEDEERDNPRSRSAKLRIFERGLREGKDSI